MRLPTFLPRRWRYRLDPILFPKSDGWPRQNWRARRARGRRGWTDSDIWNLDGYLSRVIAETLERLAEMDHGYPMEFEDNPEEWPKWLRETAALFRTYAECESVTIRDDEMANIHEGLDRLKHRWGNLWD